MRPTQSLHRKKIRATDSKSLLPERIDSKSNPFGRLAEERMQVVDCCGAKQCVTGKKSYLPSTFNVRSAPPSHLPIHLTKSWTRL